MRKKFAIANWKMNLTKSEALAYVDKFSLPDVKKSVGVVLCVPFVYIDAVQEKISHKGMDIHLGGQDVSAKASGAYTGEVSAMMLGSIGVSYCIVGHSERRQYHNEKGSLLVEKIAQLEKSNITPVFCIGEPLEVREKELHFSFVEEQLKEVYSCLSSTQIERIILAYEPVWAIGTGKTASPAQAEDMHRFIRTWIEKSYSKVIADNTSILYGGSVKSDNAEELFSCQNIDGGLVGGASLDPVAFASIASSLSKVS